ncbi:Inherit from NOG: cholinergic receptor, nicotinic [Seminavis robusta]|uniref:Circumsporozoite protein n=1 Tax=Seminavis robusta TaxID=568900 RepID=A0A9N8HVF7_9STRA|nr:Inherit from NOG: cholinergic receptor, nicotinic [Seminavis robusta]|eukprot:Sro2321_g323220.1 Inherit from NOG: cholinergic receptor, nicotinic (696) ;mRNA; r:11891-14362
MVGLKYKLCLGILLMVVMLWPCASGRLLGKEKANHKYTKAQEGEAFVQDYRNVDEMVGVRRLETTGETYSYMFDVATTLVFSGDYAWDATTEAVRDLVGSTEVYLRQYFATEHAASYSSVAASYVEPFVWEPNLGRLRFLFTAEVVFRKVGDEDHPSPSETLADATSAMNSDDYINGYVVLAEPATLFNFAIGATSTVVAQPTPNPTAAPTNMPSFGPSMIPSVKPSSHPSNSPSHAPSRFPSIPPSLSPSLRPSRAPSNGPSDAAVPSAVPSLSPYVSSSSPTTGPLPSLLPSTRPTTTQFPSTGPSLSITPSSQPSVGPSMASDTPSVPPSVASDSPSEAPSLSSSPTSAPTKVPTNAPTKEPSAVPSSLPSVSSYPSASPSATPSLLPSVSPAPTVSKHPSVAPSDPPSLLPSVSPAPTVSRSPSGPPTATPSLAPSKSPSASPLTTTIARGDIEARSHRYWTPGEGDQRRLLVEQEHDNADYDKQQLKGGIRSLQATERISYTFDVASELQFGGNYTGEPTSETVSNLIRLSGIYLKRRFASAYAASYYDVSETETEPFVWDSDLGKLQYFFETMVVFRQRGNVVVPTSNETLDTIDEAMNADIYMTGFVWDAEPNTLFPLAVGITSVVSSQTAPSVPTTATSSFNASEPSSMLLLNTTAPTMRPSTAPDITWSWTPEDVWVYSERQDGGN